MLCIPRKQRKVKKSSVFGLFNGGEMGVRTRFLNLLPSFVGVTAGLCTEASPEALKAVLAP